MFVFSKVFLLFAFFNVLLAAQLWDNKRANQFIDEYGQTAVEEVYVDPTSSEHGNLQYINPTSDELAGSDEGEPEIFLLS